MGTKCLNRINKHTGSYRSLSLSDAETFEMHPTVGTLSRLSKACSERWYFSSSAYFPFRIYSDGFNRLDEIMYHILNVCLSVHLIRYLDTAVFALCLDAYTVVVHDLAQFVYSID